MRDVLCDLLRQAYGRDDNHPPPSATTASSSAGVCSRRPSSPWSRRFCSTGWADTRTRAWSRSASSRRRRRARAVSRRWQTSSSASSSAASRHVPGDGTFDGRG
jgi:hypothetical protein